MSGEVTVDGVVYRWVIKHWEDPDAGSLNFSKRGIDNSYDFVEIHSDGRAPITFDFPDRSRFGRGWWRAPYRNDVSSEDIVRAVRIAERKSLTRLSGDDVDEALGWPNELEVATAAIKTLALRELESDELLVRCLIGLGCSGADVVLTDWVASIAPELAVARPRLQTLLEKDDSLRLERRSAFQFLIEWCSRAQIEFSLDTSKFDEAMKKQGTNGRKPFGLPWDHWWWQHGPRLYVDPWDN